MSVLEKAFMIAHQDAIRAERERDELRSLIEAHNARLRRDCDAYGNSSCKQTIGPPSICLKCPQRGVIILPESIHE